MTSSKGFHGREDLFNGFRKYYAENGQAEASPLVKARYLVNKKHNISMDDIAKYDLSVCLGVLINSTVAAFWCIFELYSRAELLEEVRDGILKVLDRHINQNVHVHIDRVSIEYPKLEAVVREILRLKAFNVSGRIILRDMVMEGGYLLKKDSVLLIPSAELHDNRAVWGETATQFDPDRFLRGTGVSSGVPASSHRTFGGGASLCPGRHVFMKEIMILLIIMVLKYDLRPASSSWKCIKGQAHIAASILAPRNDVKVVISERNSECETQWKFLWQGEEL